MKNCLVPFEEIVNYYEGRDAASTQERVRRHLENGCERCRTRLVSLQQLLPALHDAVKGEAISAPEAALALARRIARDRRPAPTHPPLRQRIAQLLFDSRQALSPATARRTVGPKTQKLYATEDHYIEVWSERMPEGACYLIGQTVAKSDNTPLRPQSVALLGPEGSRRQAIQEGNEFHLPAVADGSYRICIALEREEILLPEFVVGE
jgi:hypothetical protein